MTCKEIIEFLGGYLDGELSPQTVAEFERHLAVCTSCVAYIATYRETIRVCRFASLEDDALVDNAPKELIEAIIRSRPVR